MLIKRSIMSLAAILTVGIAFAANASALSTNETAQTPVVIAHHGSHDPKWAPEVDGRGSCHPSGCPTLVAHHGSHDPKPKPKIAHHGSHDPRPKPKFQVASL